jgi:hypothetical protein
MGTEDRRVIACNYLESTSKNSKGSIAYLGFGGDIVTRLFILTRTRSGRWVECWENARRLGNFRYKTIPPEHPLYKRLEWRDRSDTEGTARDSLPGIQEYCRERR